MTKCALGTYEILKEFIFAILLLLLLLFSFNPCNSKTVNGTGLKLCTQVGYRAVACYLFDNVHVISKTLLQAIHYNGEICVCARTMKLCIGTMPTITINIHELQICKQTSGTKSCKLLNSCASFSANKTWYTGTPNHCHDKTTL